MSGYGGSLEANTLAMIDSTGAKDSRDANEDRTFPQFSIFVFVFVNCIDPLNEKP